MGDLVAVPVMQIGVVRMAMHERGMPVLMAVWLAWRIVRRVRVLMVLVMRMPMFMFHRRVGMFMLVALG